MNTKSESMPEAQTFVRAGSLDLIPEGKSITVSIDGHVIALFHTAEGIFAVDNRCPHMGFPLDRGSVEDPRRCTTVRSWRSAQPRRGMAAGG